MKEPRFIFRCREGRKMDKFENMRKAGDRPPFLLRQSGVDEVINPKKT